MLLYLLLSAPAVIAAIIFRRVPRFVVGVIWLATIVALINLMPLGSRDFTTYVSDFYELNAGSLISAIVQDPLYASTVIFAGRLGMPGEVFYFSLASFALAIKFTALGRLSNWHTLPIALYMCSFVFIHEFTQIRAGLAIGLWMIGLSALPLSRGRYFAWTILASLVHLQAVVGLILYPIARLVTTRARARTFAVSAVGLIAISLLGVQAQLVQQALLLIPDPRVTVYIALAELSLSPPNPLSLISLLAIGTAVTGLWLPEREPSKIPLNFRSDTFIFVGLLFGSMALSVLVSVPVAALRISEHFFALLPIALWLVVDRTGEGSVKWVPLWIIAAGFLYLFLAYSPYLLDPVTGLTSREDI